MNKKEYMKPSMEVIKLQQASAILGASRNVKDYSGELGAPTFNFDDEGEE
jgi:hypothetical protein